MITSPPSGIMFSLQEKRTTKNHLGVFAPLLIIMLLCIIGRLCLVMKEITSAVIPGSMQASVIASAQSFCQGVLGSESRDFETFRLGRLWTIRCVTAKATYEIHETEQARVIALSRVDVQLPPDNTLNSQLLSREEAIWNVRHYLSTFRVKATRYKVKAFTFHEKTIWVIDCPVENAGMMKNYHFQFDRKDGELDYFRFSENKIRK